MNIKKMYVEVIAILEENKDKKVSSILDEIKAMCESQKQSSTVVYRDGQVYAIFCFEHKVWEILEHVPFGSKKNSTTGYNTMCKSGVSSWTKRQSVAKKEKADLLLKVANLEIEPQDLTKLMSDIETIRKTHPVDLDGISEWKLSKEESFDKPEK